MATIIAPTLCTGFRVWQYADQILLEPLDASPTCLAVRRSDGSLSLGGEPSLAGTVAPPKSACLLLGFVELLAGTYVLLVTNRELVDAFRGAHVFRATAFDMVACNKMDELTQAQSSDERAYLTRLHSAMLAHGLFFSYGADITTSLQKAAVSGPGEPQPLWKQVDNRFFWNSNLLQRAVNTPEAAPFLVPVMQGSFASIQSAVASCPVEVTLVARRCTDRIGTRMWRRGADSKGAVANFVETEQVMAVDGGVVASFVQVRGSIPVAWEQIVDLKYKPKIQTIVTPGPFEFPLRQHLRDLKEAYGPVIAVDLVNQTGGESRIGSAYANAVTAIQDTDIRYVAFDFHHECGHTKFHLLSRLDERVAEEIQKQGFFLQSASGSIQQQQSGVVRTNCVDCLDRTNVTQAWFARHVLEHQLRSVGLLKVSEQVTAHRDLDVKYKIMWADHGDDVSKQYTGTPALKRDFVRNGHRSTSGILQDGINSMRRYALNNFTDGVRQDGLDLVMGNFNVAAAAHSPFTNTGVEKYTNLRAAIALLFVSVFFFLRSALSSRTATASSLSPVIAAVSAAVIGVVIFAFHKFGRLFCDRPRLCPLR